VKRGALLLATVAALLLAGSCTKNYFVPPTAPDVVDVPTTPLPTHTVTFRVESVLSSDTQRAQITFGTELDGTSCRGR
jgi:hypothetical protein